LIDKQNPYYKTHKDIQTPFFIGEAQRLKEWKEDQRERSIKLDKEIEAAGGFDEWRRKRLTSQIFAPTRFHKLLNVGK